MIVAGEFKIDVLHLAAAVTGCIVAGGDGGVAQRAQGPVAGAAENLQAARQGDRIAAVDPARRAKGPVDGLSARCRAVGRGRQRAGRIGKAMRLEQDARCGSRTTCRQRSGELVQGAGPGTGRGSANLYIKAAVAVLDGMDLVSGADQVWRQHRYFML